MKRKTFDKRGWHRAASIGQSALQLPAGTLVDVLALEVTQPKTVVLGGQSLCILDTGYRWVHYAPHEAQHALTVQLDAGGVPVQFYVDVGAGSGVGAEGLPYMDDLYLDVVARVSPDWAVLNSEIIDEDELEAALKNGEVTQEQYALAWAEARRIEAALQAGAFKPVDVVRGYLSDPYT